MQPSDADRIKHAKTGTYHKFRCFFPLKKSYWFCLIGISELFGRSGKIDSGSFCLRMLILTGNPVGFAVFFKICAGLLEPERNACRFALPTDIQNPFVITDPCVISGFSADGDAFDRGIEIRRKVHRGKQRFADDFPMEKRQFAQDG